MSIVAVLATEHVQVPVVAVQAAEKYRNVILDFHINNLLGSRAMLAEILTPFDETSCRQYEDPKDKRVVTRRFLNTAAVNHPVVEVLAKRMVPLRRLTLQEVQEIEDQLLNQSMKITFQVAENDLHISY